MPQPITVVERFNAHLPEGFSGMQISREQAELIFEGSTNRYEGGEAVDTEVLTPPVEKMETNRFDRYRPKERR